MLDNQRDKNLSDIEKYLSETPLRGRSKIKIVAIGVSTGGPKALEIVIGGLPADLAVPVVVAQHMPSGFTDMLAKRLDTMSSVKVKEIEDREILKKGTVYIAQSGKQMRIELRDNEYLARIFDDVTEVYKPSVDVLFKSLAELPIASGVLGVIMTGMGNDGLQGVSELKAKGAGIIAESEKTCIVYGMPKVIIEAGLADRIVEAPGIAKAIIESIGGRS